CGPGGPPHTTPLRTGLWHRHRMRHGACAVGADRALTAQNSCRLLRKQIAIVLTLSGPPSRTHMSREVYLVGSVPMANAREVFAKVSAALGTRIKRLPDGETGERSDWISWLEPVFSDHPAFQKSGEFFRVHATGTGRGTLCAQTRNRTARRVHFNNLFYCRHRQRVVCRIQAAEKYWQHSRRHQIPGRSGAGAFRDLAVLGRRAARCDRSDL